MQREANLRSYRIPLIYVAARHEQLERLKARRQATYINKSVLLSSTWREARGGEVASGQARAEDIPAASSAHPFYHRGITRPPTKRSNPFYHRGITRPPTKRSKNFNIPSLTSPLSFTDGLASFLLRHYGMGKKDEGSAGDRDGRMG
ncbi:hypothetical protein QE152_g297 [Popillia japonica]|uniref:Uncharacterized protein n=1 Tax=Popillia japonica TaxID=7064 RepID=A0AAW1NK78_POPJA